ncbi:MAG: hypothetical protein AAB788_01815 [Patescibacteria group bacterium]
MSAMENPQIKAVKHFESTIDTKNPGNHKLIYDWVSSLSLELPKSGVASLYQGNQAHIFDKVRTFPYIDEADHFFRSEFKKNPFDGTLSQYQTGGQWNHEDRTLNQLKTIIERNGQNIQSSINTAIEEFGKSGNIRGLTNIFYYAEEQGLQIPPHIQVEALFWAEAGLDIKFLKLENNSGLKNIIRVSEVKIKDEKQKFLEKDPVLHLFRAYRLAEMLETISTG